MVRLLKPSEFFRRASPHSEASNWRVPGSNEESIIRSLGEPDSQRFYDALGVKMKSIGYSDLGLSFQFEKDELISIHREGPTPTFSQWLGRFGLIA